MPIYCYKCKECGFKDEIIHSASDTKERKCSQCGGSLERQISPVAVIFKGNGFHKNDYSHGHGRSGSPVDASVSDASGDDAKTTETIAESSVPKQEKAQVATPAQPVKDSSSSSSTGGDGSKVA